MDNNPPQLTYHQELASLVYFNVDSSSQSQDRARSSLLGLQSNKPGTYLEFPGRTSQPSKTWLLTLIMI